MYLNKETVSYSISLHSQYFPCLLECPNLVIFIGPESDHCFPLSLTNWLTNSCLVNLILLECEDSNSKLVDAVSVADVDCVGNNLLQILKLIFGQKGKLLFRLEHKVWSRFWSWSLVSLFLLMFCRGYEVESWSSFWGVKSRCWCMVKILKLKLGRDS